MTIAKVAKMVVFFSPRTLKLMMQRSLSKIGEDLGPCGFGFRDGPNMVTWSEKRRKNHHVGHVGASETGLYYSKWHRKRELRKMMIVSMINQFNCF